MLRSQFRNYTPAIRGVVNSQSATVSVIKNNRVIYQTNLPAGPFSP
ncbi:outer membrane usher protein SfmD [Salmonella enterica subsp. arizonae]|nr:outer membrane usher protein SfmD [Salmonella enterica subsp. arizonae]